MTRSAAFERWMDCADRLLFQLVTAGGRRHTSDEWRRRILFAIATGAVMMLSATMAGVDDTSPAAIPFTYATTRARRLAWVRVDRDDIWRTMTVRP